MTEHELVDLIIDSPEFKGVMATNKIEANQFEDIVVSRVPIVLEKVLAEHDWDWAIGIDDEDTVADQSDYTLKGVGDNDCSDIINVLYAPSSATTNFITLGRMSHIEIGHYDEDHTMSSPEKWILLEYDINNFPVIRLYDTPSSAGDVIRYWYRRKNVGITAFPPPFQEVFRLAMMAQFMPRYLSQYQVQVAKMIKRYRPNGGDEDPSRLGAHLESRNRSRNAKYGY